MSDIGLYSYLAGALAYGLLSVLLITSWRGRIQGGYLVTATLVTSIWAGALGLQSRFHFIHSSVIWTLELLHSLVWLLFLSRLINEALSKTEIEVQSGSFFKFQFQAISALVGFCLFLIWGLPFIQQYVAFESFSNLQIFGHVLIAVLGLVIIEQLYRNTPPEHRWHIKFLCFALGGMFAYDFYLFSDSLLFRRINSELWVARGAIIALLAPLIALAAARNPSWSIDIAVSRVVVFHSATLLGAGGYLLIMSIAGYYIKIYGGEWGTVIQIIFLAGAFLILLLLLFSGQIRARVRVFLSKHFFNYSYDYRQEWLGIISRLSDVSNDDPLAERVILALANLVESPSGLLWMIDKDGAYSLYGSYGDPNITVDRISGQDDLVQFLREQHWVINLNEVDTLPELYSGLQKPLWIQEYQNAWLFIPLFQGDKLIGLILLTQPRAVIDWNWEVIDLLRTAGQQAASYMALEGAARELAEARQFEGFNRLSAFVIHDLKNLIAQLSLVVGNAEKHAENPEFMKDAIKTVEHAVGKMNRLMSQLRNAGAVSSAKEIDLSKLLREVVISRVKQMPIPKIKQDAKGLIVEADPDRLSSTFEHIVQNAQDAAGKKGEVEITLQSNENSAIVSVEDNGCGMDKEFIRERLFKPFDTTKGLTGMGIGAYESREYIKFLGGELKVQSQLNSGTVFECIIPLHIKSSVAIGNLD